MSKEITIIGGGPGGYVAAIRASQLGAKVRLIEGDRIGGTCLNVGCVPTKALYKNAQVFRTLSAAEEFGLNIRDVALDIDRIQSRKARVVDTLVKGIEQLLTAYRVEVIYGYAEFIQPHGLKVRTREGEEIQWEAQSIIIATGSTAHLPPIPGIQEEGVLTSSQLLEFNKIPKRLAIIGGGVIGVEFAGIFQAMGSEVTIVEAEKNILTMLDADLSKRFTASLKKNQGDASSVPFLKREPMGIHTSTKVVGIEKDGDGLILLAEGKKGELRIQADAILVATGRKPVVEGLNLKAAGIHYDSRGIEVDRHFRTNVEGVYAIGDVVGRIMLAHAASYQGISAVEHIMGMENTINHDLVPNCIFTFPEIAAVGITEGEAKQKGLLYKTSKFQFAANAKALALGEEAGFVKVICDGEDMIIGVQIMGPHATDLIHEAALAIHRGLKAGDLANIIHAHPTLSEALVEASLGIKGEAIHMVPPRRRG